MSLGVSNAWTLRSSEIEPAAGVSANSSRAAGSVTAPGSSYAVQPAINR